MLLSARTARRAVAGAVGTGTIAGAMLFGAMSSAVAQPPPPAPACPVELHRRRSGRRRGRRFHGDVCLPVRAPGCELVLHQSRRSAARRSPCQGAGLPESESSGEGRPDRHPPTVGRSEEPLRRHQRRRHPRQLSLRPGGSRAVRGGGRGSHRSDGRRRPRRQDFRCARIAPFGIRRSGRCER